MTLNCSCCGLPHSPSKLTPRTVLGIETRLCPVCADGDHHGPCRMLTESAARETRLTPPITTTDTSRLSIPFTRHQLDAVIAALSIAINRNVQRATMLSNDDHVRLSSENLAMVMERHRLRNTLELFGSQPETEPAAESSPT